MELAKAYINLNDILSLGFIEDTFDDYLDMRVGEFGVYRKEGTKAVGKTSTLVMPETSRSAFLQELRVSRYF